MSDYLERIEDYFKGEILLSDITICFIIAAIIIMSMSYMYSVVSKKNKYENIMIKVGIIVRIIMFFGLVIEIINLVLMYNGIPIKDFTGKLEIVKQLSHYMLYGYLPTILIYDIYSIGIKKYRGLFHTFDLTAISTSILCWSAPILNSVRDGSQTGITELFTITLIVFFPILFFKVYWRQNIRWYLIFFAYLVINLIINWIVNENIEIEISFIPVVVAYFIVGVYELIRKLLGKGINKLSINTFENLKKVSILLPLLLIYICSIGANLAAFEFRGKYDVESEYRKNVKLMSLDEAKELARKAVGDENSNIKLLGGIDEDYDETYILLIGNYKVEMDKQSGKIVEIENLEEKFNKSGKTLSESEIKEKTIKWLKTINYTYDDTYSIMKSEKNGSQYYISIFNKYSDGSIDDDYDLSIRWNQDGTLSEAFLRTAFLNLKDSEQIKVDYSAINKSINDWYQKLGEKTQDYKINSLYFWFDERDPKIKIESKNGDRFELSCDDGQVMLFERESDDNDDDYDDYETLKKESNKIEMSKQIYDSLKDTAEDKAKILSKDWAKNDYKLSLGSADKVSKGIFKFKVLDGEMTKIISIKLDSDGNIILFDQYDKIDQKYNEDYFKVSRSTALNIISNKYEKFSTYNKKINLAAEIDDDGKIEYKWRIIVIPLKNSEHEIYYVDTETGEITRA